MTESVRIDRWLCAARIYGSRTLAQAACAAGHVRINQVLARPSHPVVVGDEISARAPRGVFVARVLGLAGKRLGPAPARALYEDCSPPPPPREERVFVRDRGSGRPTKADRRALQKLRRRS